ncbi:hypothetical protein PROFUN_08488 [Planoprotostelium fungivorum]|uniref:Uncharacterized protein n=1 Tax=Planoprotostelium fungivorum TaxID=1890364 RepID=A0A2P6N1W5_9EUKA|nr:hypothetical protein PROFUN_08488 [Planoprotostelium fungivorum]
MDSKGFFRMSKTEVDRSEHLMGTLQSSLEDGALPPPSNHSTRKQHNHRHTYQHSTKLFKMNKICYIQVLEAEEVVVRGHTGPPKCAVKINYNGSSTYRKSTSFKTGSTHWAEIFQFSVDNIRNDYISVSLREKGNHVVNSDWIGELTIRPLHYDDGEVHRRWYRLGDAKYKQHRKGGKGVLLLKIHVCSRDDKPFYKPPVEKELSYAEWIDWSEGKRAAGTAYPTGLGLPEEDYPSRSGLPYNSTTTVYNSQDSRSRSGSIQEMDNKMVQNDISRGRSKSTPQPFYDETPREKGRAPQTFFDDAPREKGMAPQTFFDEVPREKGRAMQKELSPPPKSYTPEMMRDLAQIFATVNLLEKPTEQNRQTTNTNPFLISSSQPSLSGSLYAEGFEQSIGEEIEDVSVDGSYDSPVPSPICIYTTESVPSKTVVFKDITEDEPGAAFEPVLKPFNVPVNYVEYWNDLDGVAIPISSATASVERPTGSQFIDDFLHDSNIISARENADPMSLADHSFFDQSLSESTKDLYLSDSTDSTYVPEGSTDEGAYSSEVIVEEDEETNEREDKSSSTVKDKLSSGKYKRDIRRLSSISKKKLRDWNEEYQHYYTQFVTALQRGESHMITVMKEGSVLHGLHSVAQEFADTASIYAKIIISESELPVEEKTIQPIDIGGIAGGTKYRVQNILFKFAFDTIIVDEPRLWMYGGHRADHRAAMKAAKNELKGLEMHSSRYVEGLHYPLMTIVDYKGYRLIAMPVLPIDKGTICYGSDDGGMHVHNSDEELREKMELAGKRSNLCGHVTGVTHPEVIYGPGDIEGHRGHDGRLYVVDFGRVLPPEYPKLRLHPNNRSIFSELIRPELVLSSQVPLCSDAFSKWNRDASEDIRRKLNQDVAKVSTCVREERAESILSRCYIQLSEFENLNDHPFTDERQIQMDRFTIMMHSRGLNLRHLGVLYGKCKYDAVKRSIMSVAVARCAKSELREIMRAKMKEVQTPTDEPFKQLIVKFLNQLSGRSKSSRTYWRRDLCRQLHMWFQFSLTRDQVSTFELDEMANVRLVINTIVRLCHINLTAEAYDRIRQPSPGGFSFRFVTADIRSVDVKSRHRSDIYFSGGAKALHEVKVMAERAILKKDVKHVDVDGCLRLLHLASKHMMSAIEANPTCPLYPVVLSHVYLDKARLCGTLSEIEYQWVFILIERSLSVWKDFPPARLLQIRMLEFYAKECGRQGREKKQRMIIEEVERKKKQIQQQQPWKLGFDI